MMLARTIEGVAALLLLLSACAGLGLAAFRLLRVRLSPCDGLYAVASGWGVLTLAITLGGFVRLPLHLMLFAGLSFGLVRLAASGRRAVMRALSWRMALAMLAIVPAIASAVQFQSVQFDELAQWLPNAFYLFKADALPTAALPNLITAKQGYPLAIPVVSFALSALQGAWDDRVPKILPLLLAGLFGILLAGVLKKTRRPGATAIIVASLAATLLNPFFDARTAITTYSDLPTAFILAAMAYALWRAIEAGERFGGWMARAILLAVALVQIRETNIVLIAATGLAPLFCALTSSASLTAGLRQGLLSSLRFLAAPALVFGLWRIYLLSQHIGPDMAPRPLSDWNWNAPRLVLHALFSDRFANNPVMGGAALVVGLGVLASALFFWRTLGAGARRLVLVGALISGAQLALLTFSYIAVFSTEEVARAASAWRYAAQLGPLFMLALCQILPAPAPLFATRKWARWVLPLGALALVEIAQAAGARHWRLDCTYPHARPGLEAMQRLFAMIPANASVTVINADDDLYFLGASRFQRALATGNLRATAPVVAARRDPAAPTDFTIDLSQATPTRFKPDQRSLGAALFQGAQKEPIATISVPASCPAP